MVNVRYVKNFREACELSGSRNPIYIGDDGDLFRLRGMVLNEESPIIYVCGRVTVSRFMEETMSRFHPSGVEDK